MAVVQAYRDIKRNMGQLALTGWLGAFFDERGAMNEQLLAQRLKESGLDDTKLLQMETDLREQAAKLERAKGEALAGNVKAAMDLSGNIVSAWSNVTVAQKGAESKVAVETAKERAATRNQMRKIAADARAALAHDPEATRKALSSVDSYVAAGGSAADKARLAREVFPAIDGQLRDEHGTPAEDGAVDEIVQNLRAKGRADTDALADAIADHYFHRPDNRAYMIETYGAATDEEMDEAASKEGAGVGGPGSTYDAIDAYVRSNLDNLGMTETGSSSSGTRAAEPEAEGEPAHGGKSIKVKGDPRIAGRVLGAMADPNATPESIAAAFDAGIADINDQIGTIEGKRNAKKAPIFSGANYLLDNPNWIRNTRETGAFERAGRRPVEVGERFMEDAGHDTRAFRQMGREGFNPDDWDPTSPDTVAMGQGGDASVYRYYADVLRSDVPKEEWAAALAQLPEHARSVVEPYMKLAESDKDKAAGMLEKLADDDGVTFRDLMADDIEAASKDLSKVSALVDRLEAIHGETSGPWADATKRTIDEAIRTGDKKQLQTRLARIAASMRTGAAEAGRNARAEQHIELPKEAKARAYATVHREALGAEHRADEAGRETGRTPSVEITDIGRLPTGRKEPVALVHPEPVFDDSATERNRTLTERRGGYGDRADRLQGGGIPDVTKEPVGFHETPELDAALEARANKADVDEDLTPEAAPKAASPEETHRRDLLRLAPTSVDKINALTPQQVEAAWSDKRTQAALAGGT